jgi:hypothetical protein
LDCRYKHIHRRTSLSRCQTTLLPNQNPRAIESPASAPVKVQNQASAQRHREGTQRISRKAADPAFLFAAQTRDSRHELSFPAEPLEVGLLNSFHLWLPVPEDHISAPLHFCDQLRLLQDLDSSFAKAVHRKRDNFKPLRSRHLSPKSSKRRGRSWPLKIRPQPLLQPFQAWRRDQESPFPRCDANQSNSVGKIDNQALKNRSPEKKVLAWPNMAVTGDFPGKSKTGG